MAPARNADDLSLAFASAHPRLRLAGCPEGPDLIGRYAMAAEPGLAGLAPADTWDASRLSWMVERFVQDLGHAFDAEGSPFLAALREALGAPVRFVDPSTHGDVAPLPVAAWPDPDAAGRILPALVLAYGAGATATRFGARALRAVATLADEVGIDREDALAWGLSSWAGGRRGSDLLALPGRPEA